MSVEAEKIQKILEDTAYVRTGGSDEELRCAQYLAALCASLGVEAQIEEFPVPASRIREARLICNGREIPCKGYLCVGDGDVEAPLYYLNSPDPASLAGVSGKIVLFDGYLRHWVYQDLLEKGAVGFISYDGSVNYTDRDIDQRELRASVHHGQRIPGVNINVKDAVELIRGDVQVARIVLRQEETEGVSRNVIAQLPGQTDRWIVLTAHYDSTSLSQGAYDNMTGSIGLIGILESLRDAKLRRGVRFIWCGSEERGLLGSKAYVASHDLQNIDLNINLDMIGSVMGGFIACCTCEERMVHYLQYLSAITGFGLRAKQDVYSSDSTPFADSGVPALSFARIAPQPTATIHNRYDTAALVKAEQIAIDTEFICRFTRIMADAVCCPVEREIPDNMKEKLDIYLARKRDKK